MTHPFVPQGGEEFELVHRRVSWGEIRLYYYAPGGRLQYIPEAWTDLAAPDPWVEVGGGAAYFRVDDLVRLGVLLSDLGTGEEAG